MAAHRILVRAKQLLVWTAATGLVLGGLAGPATALETVSPESVQAPTGNSCPELTAIKYPWLSCREGEFGGVTLMLPSQPALPVCTLKLPGGECAASPRPWGIIPSIPMPD